MRTDVPSMSTYLRLTYGRCAYESVYEIMVAVR